MKPLVIRSVVGALIVLSSGCIYANVKTPLSYRSPTPADVGGQMGGEVEGRACNRAILGLVAWGDGGYSAAVANAKAVSDAQMLADVRADNNLLNILGVYQELCTRVTGRVVK